MREASEFPDARASVAGPLSLEGHQGARRSQSDWELATWGMLDGADLRLSCGDGPQTGRVRLAHLQAWAADECYPPVQTVVPTVH
jgi:hypothetical protein